MSEAKEVTGEKKIELKDSTLEMSKKIVDAGFKVLKDGSVDVPDGLFENVIEGSGVAIADVKKVQNVIGEFAAGLGHALGQGSLTVMEKKKDVETVAVEVAIGKDKLAGQVNRSQTVPDGKGGQTVIYGNLSMKYTAVGAGNSRGEIKKVRQSLREQASKVLAD